MVRCPNCGYDLGGFSRPDMSSEDELYNQALKLVKETKKASAALFQRRLQIDYDRSVKLLDKLEKNGIIGPADGQSPREVFL